MTDTYEEVFRHKAAGRLPSAESVPRCSKIVAAALADRQLGSAVARHKSMFFAEKAADGALIDYDRAVHGGLRLVPAGEGLAALSKDYGQMVEDGLLLEDAEPLDVLIERCAEIEARANGVGEGM